MMSKKAFANSETGKHGTRQMIKKMELLRHIPELQAGMDLQRRFLANYLRKFQH